MNHFHIDWKKGLEMIRHRASAEIAAMLIVSIFCCCAAERYQRSAAPSAQAGQEQEGASVIATLPAVPEMTDAAGSGEISDPKQEISASQALDTEETAAENSVAEETTEEETTAEESAAAPGEEQAQEQEPLTAAKLMAQAPPSPDRLNMVYEFASDIPGEPEESYAGTAYYRLTERDEEWISKLYGNRAVAPGMLAVSLGITGKNIGNYSDWTNVGLLFYDGDGNMIQGYSNAREILAMASVYSYFHPFENIDEFYQYAEQLWKDSHKYSLSVSNVYFCEGECKYADSHTNEDDSDAAWSDPDGVLSAGTSSGDGDQTDSGTSAPASGSGNTPQGPSGPQTSSAGIPSDEEPVTAEPAAETAAATSPAETVPSAEPSVSAEEAAAPETADAPAGPLGPMSASAETQAETAAEIPSAAETAPEAVQEAALPESAPETMAASETPVESSETAVPSGPQGPLGPASAPVPEETSGISETSPETAPAPSETSPAVAETAPSRTEQTSASTGTVSQQQSSSAGNKANENECPGHVDLTIRATIIGLSESKKNLFNLDTQGSSDKNYTDTWKGWSMLRKRYVSALLEQDWFDLYGLTIPAGMYIQNPLTAAEIQYYMNMMPEDTSEERCALIELALQSVGTIPYYWGGKPSGPGYEPNGFGRPVAPDENGRGLRGLDCSGWISWLYWTALGRHLPFESTDGLYALGRQIDRSELKPGDYIVRTGDDAHVCMFLAWAPDGTMYVIHERGSTSNNVIVSNFDLYWPYYRNLLD